MKTRHIIKKYLHILLSAIVTLIFCISVTGCIDKKDEPDGPDKKPTYNPENNKMTLLIYAVASNNLSFDLRNDMSEIYEAAERLPNLNDGVTVLLYYVMPNNDYATLARLEKVEGGYSFEKVQGYDRKQFSTDPERIRRVIDDAARIAPAPYNGIVFWSHGTGWSPDFSTHGAKDNLVSGQTGNQLSSGVIKSFGQDKYQYVSDYCDIDELASAIPDNRFNFIWFDCCYMSGIELLYQLRGKCEKLVAYPTEIMAAGMPYHLTLPYLASETPDLKEAASRLFNYYVNQNQPCTVMIADMRKDKLERVAEAAGAILSDPREVSVSDLYRYTRYTIGPFFDLRQYLGKTLNPDREDAADLIDALDAALNDMINFKAMSTYDFRGVEIPQEELTAISSHVPGAVSAEKEEYYKSLDWYQRVYK